jgi:hypothetical protein
MDELPIILYPIRYNMIGFVTDSNFTCLKKGIPVPDGEWMELPIKRSDEIPPRRDVNQSLIAVGRLNPSAKECKFVCILSFVQSLFIL